MSENNNLMVCRHCLMGIEAHEGQQPVKTHYIDAPEDSDEEEIVCDWCGEWNDVLYELI